MESGWRGQEEEEEIKGQRRTGNYGDDACRLESYTNAVSSTRLPLISDLFSKLPLSFQGTAAGNLEPSLSFCVWELPMALSRFLKNFIPKKRIPKGSTSTRRVNLGGRIKYGSGVYGFG